MDDHRMTLKVPPEVHRLLRQVAASTGEKQYAVLARLLAAEWQRVQRADGTRPQKGHS
jgi:hypothetical protein